MTGKIAAQFKPTQTADGIPTTCYCCGRRATGIGMGTMRQNGDPLWLCDLCAPLMENLRGAQRFDGYELDAIKKAMDVAGEYLERIGKTDLGEFEEREAEQFIREIILGFTAGMRESVARGVPF